MDQMVINRFVSAASAKGVHLDPVWVTAVLRHAGLRLESGISVGDTTAAHLERHGRLSAGEAIQAED